MDHLTAANARIEQLLHEIEAHPDATVPPRMRELVALVSGLYGAGLARVLEILRAHPGAGEPLAARLADDPLIAPLLLLHDLHPHDVRTRVARAVDRVRTRSAMRGIGVTLLAVVPPVARVRIDSLTHACGDPGPEVAAAIEEALGGTAPEIERIEVVRGDAAPTPPLLQIARSRPGEAGATSAS